MTESTCVIDELETTSLIENLNMVKSWAEKCWLDSGFPADKMHGMLLAIEEAYANVCFHGYRDKPGPVKFQCCRGQDRSITYKITDWAGPFDVTQVATPDIKPPLADRKIGGLGVLLIREMADEIQWSYENGANTLSLKFGFILENSKS